MERSLVSAPPARTRTNSSPSSTAVPANTSSPALRSTARGSPVRVDWLTVAHPRSTTPSMHMGMPERTATTSPTLSEEAGTDLSRSPSTSCTVSGAARSVCTSSLSERARV